MLMPLISVTLIGLIGALIVTRLRQQNPRLALLAGVAGAWLGFVILGIFGVLVDVALGEGIFLVIFGHLGAAIGTVLALGRISAGTETAKYRTG